MRRQGWSPFLVCLSRLADSLTLSGDTAAKLERAFSSIDGLDEPVSSLRPLEVVGMCALETGGPARPTKRPWRLSGCNLEVVQATGRFESGRNLAHRHGLALDIIRAAFGWAMTAV